MKIGVVGSRNFNDYIKLKTELDKYHATFIISGGAVGADTLAKKYADENNIPTVIYLPDWNKYGKSAGAIRNKDIVNNSDMIVAFWDGISKGTAISINLAKKTNKTIEIIYF